MRRKPRVDIVIVCCSDCGHIANHSFLGLPKDDWIAREEEMSRRAGVRYCEKCDSDNVEVYAP